jgi:hypothetical protein
MSRAVTGLFGSKQTSPPSTTLRVSTSLYGQPIALMLGGQMRMPCNLIDNFNFAYLVQSSGGGKGGGGGKGSGGYNYYSSFIMAVCEGPILRVAGNYLNGVFDAFELFIGEEINFLGDYQQMPWETAGSEDPSRQLAYRGIHYIATAQYPLGTSPNIPQVNIEVVSTNSGNIVPGQPDGDPTIAFTQFLTNPFYGLGFPAARPSGSACRRPSRRRRRRPPISRTSATRRTARRAGRTARWWSSRTATPRSPRASW